MSYYTWLCTSCGERASGNGPAYDSWRREHHCIAGAIIGQYGTPPISDPCDPRISKMESDLAQTIKSSRPSTST